MPNLKLKGKNFIWIWQTYQIRCKTWKEKIWSH